MRMGALGLRSGERLAPAAFWASWADALAMISTRNPEIASEVVRRLDADEHFPRCVAELREASVAIDKEKVLVATQLASAPRGEKTTTNKRTRSRGHFPSSTLVLGRCHFCQAVLVLAKLTSDRTPAATRGWHWRARCS